MTSGNLLNPVSARQFDGAGMNPLDTPVALIVFNRPEATRRVFAAVAAARPSRLFIIADAPRADRQEDRQRCEEVLKIVSAVDWPCTVVTNFAPENLGCRRRMKSGLDWLFSLVEEAIILEDDCLPDPSFFPYCSQLLERYRDCSQVGIISGFNPMQRSFPFPYSYYFTKLVLIWGWATWRRTWQMYDEELTSWPRVREDGLLNLMWRDRKARQMWTGIFESMYAGVGPNAWSYQMVYTSWMRNWLNIIPSRNLIQNIGFDKDATHTKKADAGLKVPAEALGFPLAHPPAMMDWPEYAERFQNRFYTPRLLLRMRNKFESLLMSASFE
jgi:hypothetical protein